MRRIIHLSIISIVLVVLALVIIKVYSSNKTNLGRQQDSIQNPHKPFSLRVRVSENRKSLRQSLVVSNKTINQSNDYFIVEGTEKTNLLLPFNVELGPKEYYILQRNRNPKKYANILEKSYSVTKIYNDIEVGDTIEIELGFVTNEDLIVFLEKVDKYERNLGNSSQAPIDITYSNILSITMF